MLVKTGHKVRRLQRIAIAGVTDEKLKPGQHRRMSRTEVQHLYRSARGKQKKRRKRKGRKTHDSRT
jgi:16S rRNA U516 pseudouridylate synthase RsuA-like enzyme